MLSLVPLIPVLIHLYMYMQAATEVRKEVNELDNLTTGKAVDVLLNYETVKLFNNEQLEVDQYDAYLLGFQVCCSCCRLPLLGSRLHSGQSFID